MRREKREKKTEQVCVRTNMTWSTVQSAGRSTSIPCGTGALAYGLRFPRCVLGSNARRARSCGTLAEDASATSGRRDTSEASISSEILDSRRWLVKWEGILEPYHYLAAAGYLYARLARAHFFLFWRNGHMCCKMTSRWGRGKLRATAPPNVCSRGKRERRYLFGALKARHDR